MNRKSDVDKARERDRLDGSEVASVRHGSTLHQADSAVEAVLYETVRLFHRLRAVMEEIHEQGELSSGKSGILKELDRFGPRTVPAMARARPVSRQYIQTLVNALAKDGLVELLENPAHRKSSLVSLTARGHESVIRMMQREKEALDNLESEWSEEDLLTAEQVLRKLRRAFESPRWRRPVRTQSHPPG